MSIPTWRYKNDILPGKNLSKRLKRPLLPIVVYNQEYTTRSETLDEKSQQNNVNDENRQTKPGSESNGKPTPKKFRSLAAGY